MKRLDLTPRDNWQKRLEDAGCAFHTIDGCLYWRDDAAYVLSAKEVDRIEDAADELHAMCMEHASECVRDGTYLGYEFPDEVKQVIQESWTTRDLSLYGRFDLGYDGQNLKLFEYNADTPTALPEASVWQWHALEDRGWPDQFNSLHEALLGQWAALSHSTPGRIHFAAMRDGQHEDWGNLHYLVEVASEAGVDASSLAIEDIGWNGKQFVDLMERPIEALFKLYPWEWLMGDSFVWNVRASKCRFIEPAWKMLLSTKALLPLLWQQHPDHPLLLEAHFESEMQPPASGLWARKPILGREGSNITLQHGVDDVYARGPQNERYDGRGYVFQRALQPLRFLSNAGAPATPVLGAWIVGDKACGLGIREDTGPITTNASCFVPHYFTD